MEAQIRNVYKKNDIKNRERKLRNCFSILCLCWRREDCVGGEREGGRGERE